MTPKPPIPEDSPLRTFRKRDLPDKLASTYAHGHISGHPRSQAAQRTFDARKATILRTMDADQIEAAYQETVKKILTVLEEDQKKNEEIDRDIEKKTAQRELERKLYHKLKEQKAQSKADTEIKVEE